MTQSMRHLAMALSLIMVAPLALAGGGKYGDCPYKDKKAKGDKMMKKEMEKGKKGMMKKDKMHKEMMKKDSK